ncbi:post-GPI attachment to proteins factor 2-like [Archocentrus centrarchus]|uniref:post-GPI attachment to proteins factor 2-like n=1 Tax=Archocentrus centrarchus TaxID=63155 RepID=UPI0011EA2C93|nr:post-GPI attachment to proteins factor 2-like [Archocentrus centrarchus]
MLQGPYGNPDQDRLLIRLPFKTFAVGTVLLPVTGFITCIFISLFYHYEDVMHTHCKVSNYLPSISSTIARLPERYVWRVCIGLHSAPRFLVAFTYFSFYRGRFSSQRWERLLSRLAFVCGVAENAGLLLLTYVSSKENHRYHDNGFRVFTGSSLLHMLITCWLWYVIKRSYESAEEEKSYRWKLRFFVLNFICFLASYLLYKRHNERCEPGVYTLFAFFEYLVVFSNMAFHMTAFWDFGGKEVIVATPLIRH